MSDQGVFFIMEKTFLLIIHNVFNYFEIAQVSEEVDWNL